MQETPVDMDVAGTAVEEDPCTCMDTSSMERPTGPNGTIEECSVCFEVMGGACPTRKLACGHSFHHGCIKEWLQRRASCPLCKAEAPGEPPVAVSQIDMGHQEMCRLVQDLEDIFQAVHQCAGPDHPVAVCGLVFNLCASLGYEDEDELEEALGCTFVEFLMALPHFEVVWPATPNQVNSSDDSEQEAPQPRALMRPDMAEDGQSREARRIMLTVSEKVDLWRVVLQGPEATIEIPELEFAIRPSSKRKIDTIYNVIASAVYNLGDHVRLNSRGQASMPEDEANKICDAIDSLNRLLDLDSPFTFILTDPQGISDLKPIEGAHVCPYVEETSVDAESL